MAQQQGEDWKQDEVSAVVADYLLMFRLYLSGQSANKTKHRRNLQRKVTRSDGSIEFKHQNISAVLRDLDMQWLPGYLPRGNYQRLLADEVVRQIDAQPEIDTAARIDAERPAVSLVEADFRGVRVDPPKIQTKVSTPRAPSLLPASLKRDYLAREARNSSLGRAGEDFVLMYEHWRLRELNCAHLAGKIKHVSATNDAAGFDILSFDVDGRERFIEVKTTSYAKETPFFISSAELEFSRSNEDGFSLYRVFDFRASPRIFELSGCVDKHCYLDPLTYRARFS